MFKTPAIGIDLGTTFSCVGVFEHGKVTIVPDKYGKLIMPSVVSFTDEDRLFGYEAKEHAKTNPVNTVYDSKRLIGRNYQDRCVQSDAKTWPFTLVNENDRPKIKVRYHQREVCFTPEEISGMILERMKEIANDYIREVVKDAVVTVPAYFNDSQRQATKDAGKIAGLNVLRILSEPTAAAVAYGLDRKDSKDQKVLVFDLGGGTFDVSVLEIDGRCITVKATSGDTHLGGQDFDKNMTDYCAREFKKTEGIDIMGNKRALYRLKCACEVAKHILSEATETMVKVDCLYNQVDFKIKITRKRFEELNAALFASTIDVVDKALSDAKLQKHQIDEIILVGGSTRIPKVRQLLQDHFDRKQLCHSIHPDEAVAYGAATMASLLSEGVHKENENLVLLDVTPMSLGIEVIGDRTSNLLKRNRTIPTYQTEQYTTSHDNQTVVKILVLEGESENVKENNPLGSFLLEELPPAPQGDVKVDVTFQLDVNGILSVSAVEPQTGKKNRIEIKYHTGHLDRKEVERMVIEAENNKKEDNQRRALLANRNVLENYVQNVTSTIENPANSKKVHQHERHKVLTKCKSITSWLKENREATVEEYKQQMSTLQAMCKPIMDKLNSKPGLFVGMGAAGLSFSTPRKETPGLQASDID